jgi:DNA-binding beta-propeller fold protein YncE
LLSWGTPGTGPSQFNTPHSIAVDARNRVYVADRANRRIQVFGTKSDFIREIHIDVEYDPGTRPAIGNKATASGCKLERSHQVRLGKTAEAIRLDS